MDAGAFPNKPQALAATKPAGEMFDRTPVPLATTSRSFEPKAPFSVPPTVVIVVAPPTVSAPVSEVAPALATVRPPLVTVAPPAVTVRPPALTVKPLPMVAPAEVDSEVAPSVVN